MLNFFIDLVLMMKSVEMVYKQLLGGKMHFKHGSRRADPAKLQQANTFYKEINNLMYCI